MFESLKRWTRKHKKGLLIGAGILALAGCVVVAINGKKVEIPLSELSPEVPQTLTKVSEAISPPKSAVTKIFPRSSFIRLLPEGWRASANKLEQAEMLGILLNPGETLVDDCMVTMRVAGTAA